MLQSYFPLNWSYRWDTERSCGRCVWAGRVHQGRRGQGACDCPLEGPEVRLPWGVRERQERCQEQYGFQCGCQRCQLEQHWEEDEVRSTPVSAHARPHGQLKQGLSQG